MGAVGPLVAERLEPFAVEAPEALGVRAPRVDVRDLHRVDVLPDAGARRAEVRDPGGNRDPGAGQRDDRPGAVQPLRQGGDVVRGPYFPVHCGMRLPRKAPIPSRASAVWKISPKAAFSAAMPSSRSASPAVVRLIAATASGAWPPSLRAQARA